MVRSFAIITTEANPLMAPIHSRMPVIVEEPDWPVWLGEAEGDAASLLRRPPRMFCASGREPRGQQCAE